MAIVNFGEVACRKTQLRALQPVEKVSKKELREFEKKKKIKLKKESVECVPVGTIYVHPLVSMYNFYQVVKSSKSTVTLRQIDSRCVEGTPYHPMPWYVEPVKDSFINDEEFRKSVKDEMTLKGKEYYFKYEGGSLMEWLND